MMHLLVRADGEKEKSVRPSEIASTGSFGVQSYRDPMATTKEHFPIYEDNRAKR